MSRKNFKVKMLGLTIFTTAIISGAFTPIIANKIYTQAQINDPRFDGIVEYMNTTSDGVPVTLPLNDNPIAVVFENMSEQEKALAIEAIQDLDEISENINYTILDNDNYKISQKIIVRSDDKLTDKQAGGMCTYTYNNLTGEISYPIYVSLDPDCMKYVSTITGESMYTTVVKHEMMHSLGFKDMYGESDKYKTVMYYSVKTDERALDYTDFDKKSIRQIYDEGKVSVTTPSEAAISVKLEQNMKYSLTPNTEYDTPTIDDKFSTKKHFTQIYYFKEDDDYQY